MSTPALAGMLVACDVDASCREVLASHEDAPEVIIANLMDFLTPSCVSRCKRILQSATEVADTLNADIKKLKLCCPKLTF